MRCWLCVVSMAAALAACALPTADQATTTQATTAPTTTASAPEAADTLVTARAKAATDPHLVMMRRDGTETWVWVDPDGDRVLWVAPEGRCEEGAGVAQIGLKAEIWDGEAWRPAPSDQRAALNPVAALLDEAASQSLRWEEGRLRAGTWSLRFQDGRLTEAFGSGEAVAVSYDIGPVPAIWTEAIPQPVWCD